MHLEFVEPSKRYADVIPSKAAKQGGAGYGCGAVQTLLGAAEPGMEAESRKMKEICSNPDWTDALWFPMPSSVTGVRWASVVIEAGDRAGLPPGHHARLFMPVRGWRRLPRAGARGAGTSAAPAVTSTVHPPADLSPLVIGDGTSIGAGAVVYTGTSIGGQCLLGEHASCARAARSATAPSSART